jgi:hypothetical protein
MMVWDDDLGIRVPSYTSTIKNKIKKGTVCNTAAAQIFTNIGKEIEEQDPVPDDIILSSGTGFWLEMTYLGSNRCGCS